MDEQERKWVETNNVVCSLLRQAHDVLAASSLPMKRPWVGLTDEEKSDLIGEVFGNIFKAPQKSLSLARAIEAKLREKNHAI